MKNFKQWRERAIWLAAAVATVALGTGAASPRGVHDAEWRSLMPAARRWNPRLLGVRERVVYEHIDHQTLTFYLFRPRGSTASARPVVVYVHGGALRYGSALISARNTPHNHLMVAVERKLIQQGVDFVSVNYRLAPVYPWPDALRDVRHAVLYLRLHAHTLNINPQRMAVMGDSAGGELSSFVGLTMKSDTTPAMPLMRGVVDLFGPVNRRTFAVAWRKRHGLAPNPVYGVYTWKRVKRESAVDYVHPGAPPFLIVQGTRDRIVPPAQSRMLKQKLVQAHVPTTEIVVHHAGHELVAKHRPIAPSIPVIANRIVTFLDDELGVSAGS